MISSTQFISGNEIAKLCDHIFSQTAFDKNSETHYRVVINSNVVKEIKTGQSVFVKSDFLMDFFRLIQNRKDLHDIKVVTHDSDKIIDNLIAEKIPSLVKTMFSVNVVTKNEKIVSIPLGIANDYCGITLKPKTQSQFDIRSTKALITCQIENNLAERLPLFQHKFDRNVTTLTQKVTLEEYSKLLEEHDFVFCPEGNGPDTHRIWESIYMGKIPIVKKSIWNENFRDLPILFVDKFSDCSESLRENFIISKLQNCNLEKSNLDFWRSSI